jgi:hypothetical protein
MDWATFWATFFQTHLVTLYFVYFLTCLFLVVTKLENPISFIISDSPSAGLAPDKPVDPDPLTGSDERLFCRRRRSRSRSQYCKNQHQLQGLGSML